MGLTNFDEMHIVSDNVLSLDPLTPNKETIAAIQEARSEKLRSFSSVKSLMDDLNKGD